MSRSILKHCSCFCYQHFLDQKMSSRSPKTPKSNKKKSTTSSSSKKKTSRLSLANEESSDMNQRQKLLTGQFYVCATLETSENQRPRPLRVTINTEDMLDLHLSAGDFVMIQKATSTQSSNNMALGMVWPSQSLLATSKIQSFVISKMFRSIL